MPRFGHRTITRWVEFLLGAPPAFDEYSFDGDEPPPLPERLGRELAISLEPQARGPLR